MQAPSEAEVALLERYSAAFRDRDLDAAVSVYAFPAVFVSNQGTRVVADADAIRTIIAASWAEYDTLSVATAELELGEGAAYSDDLHQVHVHWLVRRKDGSTLWHYPIWYLLRRTPEGWRIAMVLAPERK